MNKLFRAILIDATIFAGIAFLRGYRTFYEIVMYAIAGIAAGILSFLLANQPMTIKVIGFVAGLILIAVYLYFAKLLI